MTELSALWLPIILSSVIVFIVSSAIHTLPLWHRRDYPPVPQEDKVMDALRPFAIPPGEYMFPHAAGMKEMRSPEFIEKRKKGPVMLINVYPAGQMGMGKNLVQWFCYTIIIGIFSAYLAGRALPPGAQYLQVFRFAGTTAFIAYTVASWQRMVWYGQSWGITIKMTLDGIIYGLLTGGVFGWLWPQFM